MEGPLKKQQGPACRQAGFTFIELLLVVGIIGILLGLATINLVTAQHNATVSAAVDQLVSDLKSQQTKAMTGAQDATGSQNSYGVHITTNNYILFQGISDVNASGDFSVSQPGISFSTNLPNSSIVFGEHSGEADFGTGYYTITITNTNGTESKTLTINKYGVITSKQ